MTIATLTERSFAVLADARADVAVVEAVAAASVETLEVAVRRIARGISVIEARRALSDEDGDSDDDDWEDEDEDDDWDDDDDDEEDEDDDWDDDDDEEDDWDDDDDEDDDWEDDE